MGSLVAPQARLRHALAWLNPKGKSPVRRRRRRPYPTPLVMMSRQPEESAMLLKVRLSIGYPTADHEDEIEVDDAHLADLSPEEREAFFDAEVREWAMQYVE